ncbi:WxL protein peptidoglycan domain-containing protein [Actinoplanes sp. CA-015351]|uniref:WxL protein peptidoglycan domain-containing protein n=1 Tax=Actinoplanes sp. CA-015351 TaxID=3239897 RepID=UPI003D97AA3B
MRIALVLAAVVAALVPGAPALAADGDVTWTVRTASNSYGADRSSYTYAVNAGAETSDALVVANHGKAPITLAVYTADGYTTGEGQLDLLTADKKSVAIGAWVHASAATVTVPAGASAEVPFTVDVPANATPGDYVGGILTSLTQASQETINVERRLGIKIKLRVGGDLVPGLAVEDLKVSFDGPSAGSLAGAFGGGAFGKGDATVSYTIRNTGNAVESARQQVSIAGPFGWLRTDAGAIDAPPELLPGESWTVTVPVHNVSPAVLLAATATLTPLLTDASGSTTSLDPVTATARVWAFPWSLTVLVVALIALLIAAVILTRRRRATRKQREEERVREAVAEALREKATT